jgi:hypothetical protein
VLSANLVHRCTLSAHGLHDTAAGACLESQIAVADKLTFARSLSKASRIIRQIPSPQSFHIRRAAEGVPGEALEPRASRGAASPGAHAGGHLPLHRRYVYVGPQARPCTHPSRTPKSLRARAHPPPASRSENTRDRTHAYHPSPPPALYPRQCFQRNPRHVQAHHQSHCCAGQAGRGPRHRAPSTSASLTTCWRCLCPSSSPCCST